MKKALLVSGLTVAYLFGAVASYWGFLLVNYFKDRRRKSSCKDMDFKDWYKNPNTYDVIDAAQCFALLWGPLVPICTVAAIGYGFILLFSWPFKKMLHV